MFSTSCLYDILISEIFHLVFYSIGPNTQSPLMRENLLTGSIRAPATGAGIEN
jgi:hypothetical protein